MRLLFQNCLGGLAASSGLQPTLACNYSLPFPRPAGLELNYIKAANCASLGRDTCAACDFLASSSKAGGKLELVTSWHGACVHEVQASA